MLVRCDAVAPCAHETFRDAVNAKGSTTDRARREHPYGDKKRPPHPPVGARTPQTSHASLKRSKRQVRWPAHIGSRGSADVKSRVSGVSGDSGAETATCAFVLNPASQTTNLGPAEPPESGRKGSAEADFQVEGDSERNPAKMPKFADEVGYFPSTPRMEGFSAALEQVMSDDVTTPEGQNRDGVRKTGRVSQVLASSAGGEQSLPSSPKGLVPDRPKMVGSGGPKPGKADSRVTSGIAGNIASELFQRNRDKTNCGDGLTHVGQKSSSSGVKSPTRHEIPHESHDEEREVSTPRRKQVRKDNGFRPDDTQHSDVYDAAMESGRAHVRRVRRTAQLCCTNSAGK